MQKFRAKSAVGDVCDKQSKQCSRRRGCWLQGTNNPDEKFSVINIYKGYSLYNRNQDRIVPSTTSLSFPSKPFNVVRRYELITISCPPLANLAVVTGTHLK